MIIPHEIKNPEYHGHKPPRFYREAREQCNRAYKDLMTAADMLNSTPPWAGDERKLGRERYKLYLRLYKEQEAKALSMYYHWIELLEYASKECKCTPEEMCRSCVSTIRLHDDSYQPSESEED